jgi:uncharacterized protein YaiE (UPF0345 family)
MAIPKQNIGENNILKLLRHFVVIIVAGEFKFSRSRPTRVKKMQGSLHMTNSKAHEISQYMNEIFVFRIDCQSQTISIHNSA